MTFRDQLRSSPLAPVIRTVRKSWHARRERNRKRKESRIFREKQLQFLSGFIGKETLCFDIGANIGDRSFLYRQITRRVIAVEPQPDCVAALRRRFLSDQHLKIEAVAVGEKPGIANMWLADNSIYSTLDPSFISDAQRSGRFHENRWQKQIPVPLTTLDDLIKKYGRPHFLKVDVEGFEIHVFRGLSEPIPLICFEFLQERLAYATECLRQLSILAPLECNLSLGESFEFASSSWFSPEEAIEFIRRDRTDFCWGDLYVKMHFPS